MKFVYLDKKDRVATWLSPTRKLVLSVAGIVFVILPIWHETAVGRFVLEPVNVAVVRALVAGTVARIYADEGQTVQAGDPIVQLRNVRLESKLARSQSEFDGATQRAHSAFLHYTDFGPAATDRERLGQQTRQITSEVSSLAVTSPLSGVVMTPRVSDKVGTYILPGAELAEVADLSRMRARIYVSEFEMYKFNADSPARLQLDGRWGKLYARTSGIAPLSSDVAPGLIDLSKYKGQRAPRFYVFDLSVENTTGSMRPGMAGTARLYGLRRSLASLAAHTVWEFLGRKIW